MNIEAKVLRIQRRLKAPKSQYNSFGKYYYRSCEDILEAVKPLCDEEKCLLTISDQVVLIGDRYYVQALATIIDIESGESIAKSAMAREELEKKGSDASQITGAASTYARKYALNGLFLIDDNKDADTDESKIAEQSAEEKKAVKKDTKKESAKKEGKLPTEKISALITKCQKDNVSIEYICSVFRVKSLYQLSEAQWMNIIQNWSEVVEGAHGSEGKDN